jgi:hypothetical protein
MLQFIDILTDRLKIVLEMPDLFLCGSTAFHPFPVLDRLMEDPQLIDEEIEFGYP